MKLPEKQIRELIIDIKMIQNECQDSGTMFVYHALDKALNHIGWTFAQLLEEKLRKRKGKQNSQDISKRLESEHNCNCCQAPNA